MLHAKKKISPINKQTESTMLDTLIDIAETEDYNKVLDLYKSFLKQNNNGIKDVRVHVVAMIAIVELEQWNKAWDIYCRAVKQKQFHERIFQETAVCLCEVYDYKKASIVFFKSVELKQTNSIIFAQVANAYTNAANSAKNKKEKATIEIKRAKFIKEARKVAPKVVEESFAATLAKQAREGIAA